MTRTTQNNQLSNCREAIDPVIDRMESLLRHWRALPRSVKLGIMLVRRKIDDKTVPEEERSLAAEAAAILQRFAGFDEIPIPQARELNDEIKVTIERSKSMPAHEKEGSLYQALHSTLEQQLYVAVDGIDYLNPKLCEELQKLSLLIREEWKKPCDELLDQIAECQDISLSVLKLEELCHSLRRICQSLPLPEPRNNLYMTGVRTHHFRILVIEDSEEWRMDIHGAIARVKRMLGEDFKIEEFFADNLEDALKIVDDEKGKVVPQDIDANDERVQTIAICDMGLPKDKRHAEEIRAGLSTPDRENGFQLLENLREYTVNIPVVFLTAPPHDLEDHLRATRFGVSEVIYKLPENLEELEDALLKIIRRNQSHHIKLWLSDRVILIDKVKITLPETSFKTFYALCKLSSASRSPGKIFTVDEILGQLSRTFNEFTYKRPPQDDYEKAKILARTRRRDWWTAGTDQNLTNYINIWANKKRDAGGNSRKALNEFKDILSWVEWRSALQLIERYTLEKNPAHRIDQNNEEEMIVAIDEFFGGLDLQDKVDEYRRKNISDHIYEIRNSIASDFNKLGMHLCPENDIVISRKFIDDKGNEVHGYRVKGTFELVKESENIIRSGVLPNSRDCKPVRVLVVENEPSFQMEIRKQLESAQFEVIVVTNLEDAIGEIESGTSFEILCLDMHIPETRAQYEENPSAGHYSNGLKFLEYLRKSGRSAQVIILTDYSNQDALREQVARLDVLVRNFAPKGISREDGSWEGRLLNIAHRLRQEIWDEMIIPDWNNAPVLTIGLEKGTNLDIGVLNLSVNGRAVSYRKSLKSRMLALLLRKPREWIKDEDMAQWIYGESADLKNVNNQLKMLRREVHKSIHKEWLGKSDNEPLELPKQILKTEDCRTILWVYVETTSPHLTY